MTLRFPLIIGLFLGIASCNKGVEPETVNYYPMAKGDSWTYSGVDSQYNYRPTIPEYSWQNRSWHWIQHSSVVGLRTLPDSTRAWQIHSTENIFNFDYTSDHYYRVERDTLKLVADSGGGVGLPKRSQQLFYSFKGSRYGSIRELTAAYRLDTPLPASGLSGMQLLEHPQRVLLLPLRVGEQWSLNPEGTAPFKLWKKVVGTESVQTPAGAYSCYKIQWLWDSDNDVGYDRDIWEFDFVCTRGIIVRVLHVKDVMIATEQHPEGVGLIDIMEMRTATDINIQPTYEQ